MSYVKQTWNTGDIVTAEKLNHIEEGIDDLNEVQPNPTPSENMSVLNTIKIGKVHEERVTSEVTCTYGAYTKGTSSFSSDNTRAYVVMDVSTGDSLNIIDADKQMLIYKLVNGTTTYDSDIRSDYSSDNWTSTNNQRIIVVFKSISHPSSTICTADQLLDIVNWTHNETISNIYKIGGEEEKNLQKEINFGRTDFGKEMPTGVDYYVESDVMVCKCILNTKSGSTLKLWTNNSMGVARGSASFVNFDNGTIGFYAGNTSSPSSTIKYSKNISFTIVQGHQFVIENIKREKLHTIKITDAYTLESDELSVIPTGSGDIGERWGKRTYTASSGITVQSFRDYSLEPYDCRLLIIGDSFIEGANGFVENHLNRYCERFKRILMGSCSIAGFGGATITQIRTFYNNMKNIVNPKYVLIAGGTNDTNYSTYSTQIQALITEIKAQNSIPILVTITRRMDQNTLAFMRQANNWVRNESGELYMDFNIITTLNYDGETQNTSMFAADGVHPLPSTHILMTKRGLLDTPEVFNMEENYIVNRPGIGKAVD